MTAPLDIAALRQMAQMLAGSSNMVMLSGEQVLALLDRLEAAEAVLRDVDTSFGYVGFRSPGAVVLERYQTWQRLARGEGC